MLGKLIAELDRPEVAAGVLAALDLHVMANVERRAATASMTAIEFAAGAIRAFMDHADDDLWFQLLTVMRKSDDPGGAAVEAILKWAVTSG